MAAGGTPGNVHLGAGRLYKAPIGTTEPASCSAALPSAWIAVGYTEDGTEISTDISSEDIEVAEELDPIDTVQTRRITTISVQPAEMTVNNLATSLGGEVTRTNNAVAYEFPDADDIVAFMLVWDSDETPSATNRRWLFRSVKPTGTIATARRKAPQKALLPMELRANKASNGDAAVKVFPNSSGRV